MKTIKIKGEVYEACEAFPTIFEFKDEEGNELDRLHLTRQLL